MVKSLFFDYINSPAQRIFEVGDESAREERSRVRTSFNQEIEVAVRASPVVNERSEDFNAGDSMAMRDRQNPIPVTYW